jgi:two-component system chemotaxis sensor kinase CheA
MDDLLAEFVAETREMLEASEGELIAWEADPSDHSRLGAIFRFVHTVKGNSGFFDVPQLEKLSHAAEDALAEVRAGKREADQPLVAAILGIIDRIMELVDLLEAGEKLPDTGYEALIAALSISGDVSPSDKLEVAKETPQQDATGNKKEASLTPRSIRLPVDLLDRVMSGVSDMVLARNDLAHRLQQAGTQPTIDGPFERLSTILADVRDAITRMRMQRVELLFGAFPRLVRDLAGELNKQVAVDLEGGDVELDREMIEMIRDPMTHLVRNAIDHGIEPAAVRAKAGKPEQGILGISARQSGNKISIVVSDDGSGLDEEKIASKAVANGLITKADREEMSREEILQLIFAPGLSTADKVSSISGRGVGLDVVRENIEKIGGNIKVTSTPGVGTLFYLQIPLTLSIISGLTVEVGGQRFALPQSYVEEIVRLGSDALSYVKLGDTSLVTFRGERLPCLSLADVLGSKHAVDENKRTMVMLRLASGDLFALAVDQIHNSTDLVVKPLPRAVMATELYGGSTLLDNGVPILLLDIPLIAMNAGLVSDTRTAIIKRDRTNVEDQEQEGVRAILFTDCMGNKRAVRMELIQRIETISADAIDRDGKAVMAVVSDEILPLVGAENVKDDASNLRLLRLSDGNADLAYAVNEVQDSILLNNELVEVADDPLVEAKVLVDGEPVALIDGHELFAQYGKAPKRKHQLTCHLPNGEWAQSILAPLLENAGYVIKSDDEADADILITLDDTENPASKTDDSNIIRLRSLPDQDVDDDEKTGSIYRYDREALLSALRRITRGEAA